MNKVEQYFFSAGDSQFATEGLLPLLPLELIFQGQSLQVEGLLDTGATVNVRNQMNDKSIHYQSFY